MNTLARDISQAFFMGIVVPYLLLSAVVGYRDRQGGAPVFEKADTVVQAEASPIDLRMPDGAVEHMALGDYLTGVLLAEIPSDFESEAIRAQAVAARTFALKNSLQDGKHGDGTLCTDSSCCQAYIDDEKFLRSGGTEGEIEKMREAVSDTHGEVLQFEGALIEATYYSCSGGRTEDAVAVWGTDYPYLISVSSPGEEAAAYYRSTVSFTPEEFCQRLGRVLPGEPTSWFGSAAYTDGGGIESLEIGGEAYPGTQLRKLLGLRSAAFTVYPSKTEIVIETSGYGHRVGMSQYGANAMAATGATCEQILEHYYPGTKLEYIDEKR